MEESSSLKLIIEKGPREGETLEYPSGTVVKIGRVVRGNTIGIKDAGISSKHICIQFDHELCRWCLSDLDSSNGTILNGQSLKPYVPSGLNDGDCIKIGELTSILVKIGVEEATIRSERKPRRQGKSGAGAGAVVESERSGLGLGLDGDLGKSAPMEKRNLRSRAKKSVDLKNEVESLSSKRTLRSSKKEEKVSFIPTLNQIPEDLNLDERKATDLIVPIEGKKTQGRGKGGRKRKLTVQIPQDTDIVVPIDVKKTGRGRKVLPVDPLENIQNSVLEENLNKAEESLRAQGAYEAKDSACDEYPVDQLENVENSGLEGNLDTTNESAQDLVAEKLVLMQEGCQGKEAIVDRSSLKGSSEVAHQVHVDKGKEVVEELEYRRDGCEDLVKGIGPDSSHWLDLEKMTLGEFFDCLKVQLPKEMYDKSEKILSHLKENARKCHEFRLQKSEKGEEYSSYIPVVSIGSLVFYGIDARLLVDHAHGVQIHDTNTRQSFGVANQDEKSPGPGTSTLAVKIEVDDQLVAQNGNFGENMAEDGSAMEGETTVTYADVNQQKMSPQFDTEQVVIKVEVDDQPVAENENSDGNIAEEERAGRLQIVAIHRDENQLLASISYMLPPATILQIPKKFRVIMRTNPPLLERIFTT
ncbi:hypothetical protein L6452_15584 [Arctium lappa]|uniref:Uncharacterized protein n=1 Tax=Arctium lappa TaxID=4217 RepID=A0ACB9CP39_ARCLA|nr:hypothetical protein L6452_15584 [Arctium lappa]